MLEISSKTFFYDATLHLSSSLLIKNFPIVQHCISPVQYFALNDWTVHNESITEIHSWVTTSRNIYQFWTGHTILGQLHFKSFVQLHTGNYQRLVSINEHKNSKICCKSEKGYNNQLKMVALCVCCIHLTIRAFSHFFAYSMRLQGRLPSPSVCLNVSPVNYIWFRWLGNAVPNNLRNMESLTFLHFCEIRPSDTAWITHRIPLKKK